MNTSVLSFHRSVSQTNLGSGTLWRTGWYQTLRLLMTHFTQMFYTVRNKVLVFCRPRRVRQSSWTHASLVKNAAGFRLSAIG